MSSAPPGPKPEREWNAETYHRISDPQFGWGREVLARLLLRGDETLLDAGCGSGRLTAELLERLPAGRVIAVDLSENMLWEAREHLIPRFGPRVRFLRADLQALPISGAVDAIFSAATLHWARDHPRLFRSLFAALKPGGRLVAQCGGGPNLARLLERAGEILASSTYARYFAGWPGPWEFADAPTTAERLRAAGFVCVATNVHPAPTVLPDAPTYRQFLATVIYRLHLARISEEELRGRFLDLMTEHGARDDPPFTLDYWRLNIEARVPQRRR